MRAGERGHPRTRRPSTGALLGRQIAYQLKLLARSPMAAFATLVIPLMVLLAVNLLYAGTHLRSRGGIPFAQFFTPAMVAFAVVNACYVSVISSTTLARDQGILKRIRSTPLPPWVYLAGRIVSSGLVAVAGAVVVTAVGAAVYGFHMIWAAVPAALLTLAVGIFCFCALGLAVTVLVPSVDAALPIAWGTMLSLCFVSDIFQPIDNAPHWLRTLASAFPLRPFADDLESAFNPVTGTHGVHFAHLGLMAAWGLAAAAFALLAFRWEPGGRGRAGGRSPLRGTVAAAFRTLPRQGRLQRRRGLLDQRTAGVSAGARPPPRKAPDTAPLERDTAPIERIEGPAPTEDSSVPPETPAKTLPARQPTDQRQPAAASGRPGAMRSNSPSESGRGADGGARRRGHHRSVGSSSRSSEVDNGAAGR